MDIISPITGNPSLFADGSLSATKAAMKHVSETQNFQQLLQTSDSESDAISDGSTAKSDAARKFEVMVLSQFIAEVFREQPDEAFGDGMQGDFYVSIYSEAIAEKVVDAGGIGIVELL